MFTKEYYTDLKKILRIQIKLRDSNAIQIKENQRNMSIKQQINNPLLFFTWKIPALNDIFDRNNLQKDN